MNFDFSEGQKLLQQTTRGFLEHRAPRGPIRTFRSTRSQWGGGSADDPFRSGDGRARCGS